MNKDKEKLAVVLDKILERLDVIDAGQARMLGHTTQMRETLHRINNELATMKLNQACDSDEIGKILKRLDTITGQLNEKALKEYVKDAAG